jgi:signal transduction histidine kinase
MESILVVDDEKNIRVTISEFLRDRKYTIYPAEDAMTAIEILRTTPIDLVISDIMMPQMKGTDLLAHIREEYPEIKTILITGQASLENATASLRGRAFDYLQKPVTKNTLLSTVDKACRILNLDRLNKRLMNENRQYREQLEELLHQKSGNLSKLSSRIVTVQDDERRQVAQEIERLIGQSLIALKLDLQSALQGSESNDSDAVYAHLDTIIAQTLSIASNLNPISIESDDLVLIANRVREDFGSSHGCTIEVRGEASLQPGKSERAAIIGRIIREAVSNAIRHGKASAISISLRTENDQIVLEIQDNGCGFGPDALGADYHRGIGILLMQERSSSIGAVLTIQTNPGKGSTVTLLIPTSS